tara:strand:+ start:5604 stop:6299 length:696 start_codon:yes stop_codon:yes gene_type:complete
MNKRVKRDRIFALIFGVLFFVALFVLSEWIESPKEFQKEVRLEITHPTLPIVNFLVPTEYLGPRLLELSKKNHLGGEQKRFLIQFYYPSMLPATIENKKLDQSGVVMYASIATSIRRSNRYAIELKSEKVGAKYQLTSEACGLQKYEELPDYYVGSTLYHHFNEIDPSNDIHINCAGKLCRMFWVSDIPSNSELLLSVTLNGLPTGSICEWESVTLKVNQLIEKFQSAKGN